MNRVLRPLIVVLTACVLVLVIVAPPWLAPVSAHPGASASLSYSAGDCETARSWITAANGIARTASETAQADLNAGDVNGSIVVAVEARHDVAALNYSPAVKQLRADTLDALDELAYQSALIVTDPGSVDETVVTGIIAAMRADAVAVQTACPGAGSV